MKVNKYNHIFIRVDYPREGGYRMELKELPPWMHITIITKDDSKVLTVHSRIHVSKEAKVGPSYSTEFSDHDILKDLSNKITYRYGL